MHENQNKRGTWETGQEWKEQKGAETPRRDRYKGGNGHTRTEKGLGRDLGPHRSLLGAPQRRDQAQVTLGRSPHCLRGSRLARAIPERLLEAGPLGGAWEPLEPGGQATRKTADRVSAPAHNYPPAPASTANELGFDPQHHSRPQRDCLAPAGRLRGRRAAESGPEPTGPTAPPAQGPGQPPLWAAGPHSQAAGRPPEGAAPRGPSPVASPGVVRWARRL